MPFAKNVTLDLREYNTFVIKEVSILRNSRDRPSLCEATREEAPVTVSIRRPQIFSEIFASRFS